MHTNDTEIEKEHSVKDELALIEFAIDIEQCRCRSIFRDKFFTILYYLARGWKEKWASIISRI